MTPPRGWITPVTAAMPVPRMVPMTYTQIRFFRQPFISTPCRFIHPAYGSSRITGNTWPGEYATQSDNKKFLPVNFLELKQPP